LGNLALPDAVLPIKCHLAGNEMNFLFAFIPSIAQLWWSIVIVGILFNFARCLFYCAEPKQNRTYESFKLLWL